MNKKFDIIVYGATGFTGSLCVKYLKENYSGLTWGIAGRNQEKLENLVARWIQDPSSFIGPNGDFSTLYYQKETW